MSRVEVKIPDIGDFEAVEVVELLVSVGDTVAVEDSLITIESDKASMEVPATEAGVVEELRVNVGDAVSEGDVIVVLSASAQDAAPEPADSPAEVPEETKASPPAAPPVADPARQRGPATGTSEAAELSEDAYDVVVIGSGPGGYTAAFRAADLGLRVALVERYNSLGGVCLNVGCIPSKALLHVANVIDEVEAMKEHGLEYESKRIELKKLVAFKQSVVDQLTRGLGGLAKQRKVQVVHGTARFAGRNELEIQSENGETGERLSFRHAIVAAGSQAVKLPFLPEDERVLDSTSALEINFFPKRLLVIGGGIIGLEMATVYHSLGSKVSVVELQPGLMPGTDRDLVRPLERRIKKRYEKIYTSTKVTSVEARDDGLLARLEPETGEAVEELYDAVLVAVGRRPNGKTLGLEALGVAVNERGFVPVDAQQRTNVANIFAIGDIASEPMLAHKATYEGKIAAEVIAGEKVANDALVIPSVAYTDPEVAWVGLTETEAKEHDIKYELGTFPWAASGRSLTLGRKEGLTKLLFDPDTHQVLGAGIVGNHAGDLIAEAVLAIEMRADARDLALTIHPHPTLSETLAFSAEAFEGTITDLYAPRKRSG